MNEFNKDVRHALYEKRLYAYNRETTQYYRCGCDMIGEITYTSISEKDVPDGVKKYLKFLGKKNTT